MVIPIQIPQVLIVGETDHSMSVQTGSRWGNMNTTGGARGCDVSLNISADWIEVGI